MKRNEKKIIVKRENEPFIFESLQISYRWFCTALNPSISFTQAHFRCAYVTLCHRLCVCAIPNKTTKLSKTMVWTRFSFIHRTLLNACSNNQLQHCTKPIITYLLNGLNAILNYTILYMAHHIHKKRARERHEKYKMCTRKRPEQKQQQQQPNSLKA